MVSSVGYREQLCADDGAVRGPENGNVLCRRWMYKVWLVLEENIARLLNYV